MKRPTRTVKRESIVTYRDRPLVLIVSPMADVLLVREKGRRKALEIDILSIWSVANKLSAAKIREQRKLKRRK